MRRFRLVKTILTSVLLSASVAGTQTEPPQPLYVTTGIFIGSIEEGARIFTPVRLLPFGHPEALDGDRSEAILVFEDNARATRRKR